MSAIMFLFEKDKIGALAASSPKDIGGYKQLQEINDGISMFAIGNTELCIYFEIFVKQTMLESNPLNIEEWESYTYEWIRNYSAPSTPTTMGFIGERNGSLHIVAFDFDVPINPTFNILDYSVDKDGDVAKIFFCSPDVDLDAINDMLDGAQSFYMDHLSSQGSSIWLVRCLYGIYKKLVEDGVLVEDSYIYWQYPKELPD